MNDAIRSISQLLQSAMIPTFVILGIFALVAAFDKERPRLRWAKQSLLLFATVAISTGVLTYLVASGAISFRGHPVRWSPVLGVMRGTTYGMFIVLLMSGQFWVKKGPSGPLPGSENG
jgi:hypothetical protein